MKKDQLKKLKVFLRQKQRLVHNIKLKAYTIKVRNAYHYNKTSSKFFIIQHFNFCTFF